MKRKSFTVLTYRKFRAPERLAEHATMREDGLSCSETMLETDTKAFLMFFNQIKESTQQASKKHKETKELRGEKNAELRSIDD